MTYGSKKDGWLFGFVWGVVPGPPAVGTPVRARAVRKPRARVVARPPARRVPEGRRAARAPHLAGGKLSFMRDLAGAAPGLELRGDRVVRNV